MSDNALQSLKNFCVRKRSLLGTEYPALCGVLEVDGILVASDKIAAGFILPEGKQGDIEAVNAITLCGGVCKIGVNWRKGIRAVLDPFHMDDGAVLSMLTLCERAIREKTGERLAGSAVLLFKNRRLELFTDVKEQSRNAAKADEVVNGICLNARYLKTAFEFMQGGEKGVYVYAGGSDKPLVLWDGAYRGCVLMPIQLESFCVHWYAEYMSSLAIDNGV